MSVPSRALGMAATVSAEQFTWFRTFIQEQTGISLSDGKQTLVTGRLQSMVREWDTGDFAGLMSRLRRDPPKKMMLDFVNRITTNHTYFHRESTHYELLRDLCLPDVRTMCGPERDLRLWCAAASTGQEPYELAMVLREYFGTEYGRWQAGVLGTDIAEAALRFAMEGVYEASDVERLPTAYQRHFRPTKDGRMQASAALREDVLFRRYNLIEPNYRFRHPFHVIFCRNVLIYFDERIKARVVDQLVSCLEPGGYLFVGHTESLGRKRPGLETVAPSVYRKVTQ